MYAVLVVLFFVALLIIWISKVKLTKKTVVIAKEVERWETVYSGKKHWYDQTNYYSWLVLVRFSRIHNLYKVTHFCNSNNEDQTMAYKECYKKAMAIVGEHKAIFIN